MDIIATGIDLAKNVFAVHGVNLGGGVQLRGSMPFRVEPNSLIWRVLG